MVAVRSGRFRLMMSNGVAERGLKDESIGQGGLRKCGTSLKEGGYGLVEAKVPLQFISGVAVISGERSLDSGVRSAAAAAVTLLSSRTCTLLHGSVRDLVIRSGEWRSGVW